MNYELVRSMVSDLHKEIEKFSAHDRGPWFYLAYICGGIVGAGYIVITHGNMPEGVVIGSYFGITVKRTISKFIEPRILKQKAKNLFNLIREELTQTKGLALLLNELVHETKTWNAKLITNKKFKESLDNYTRRYLECCKTRHNKR